jgi:hypothetical protein
MWYIIKRILYINGKHEYFIVAKCKRKYKSVERILWRPPAICDCVRLSEIIRWHERIEHELKELNNKWMTEKRFIKTMRRLIRENYKREKKRRESYRRLKEFVERKFERVITPRAKKEYPIVIIRDPNHMPRFVFDKALRVIIVRDHDRPAVYLFKRSLAITYYKYNDRVSIFISYNENENKFEKMIEIARMMKKEIIETVLKVVERERKLEEPETHLYKMLEKAENILRQLLAMNEMFSDEKL